jgi:hypothetical protein
MDPITKMTQAFVKRWHRFRMSTTARLFRIDTDPSMHRDLTRLLRGLESAPDNRSPYFIFDARFADSTEFYKAAVEKLKSDYQLLKEGLAADGVTVGDLPVTLGSQQTPEEVFALFVEAVWDQVKDQFDYLMVVVLPSRIENRPEWPRTVEQLVRVFAKSKVRIVAGDIPDGLLKGLCGNLPKYCMTGRFFVSSSTMQDYLMKVAKGGWAAVSGVRAPLAGSIPKGPPAVGRPGAPPPSGTAPDPTKIPPVAPKKQDLPSGAPPAGGTISLAEPKLPPGAPKTGVQSPEPPPAGAAGSPAGPKVLPPDEAVNLRTLMATAAAASAENKPREAIQALQEARSVCQRNGLLVEEAIVVMAIGNTLLATSMPDQAIQQYSESATVARRAESPVIVTQAHLAVGSTLFRKEEYDLSAKMYEVAAADAVVSESEILRIEALRMAGTCHNIRNRPGEAARCWNDALGAGEKMSMAEIKASTFEQVGQAFIELCKKRGLTEQAKSVAQQIEATKQKAAARDTAH